MRLAPGSRCGVRDDRRSEVYASRKPPVQSLKRKTKNEEWNRRAPDHVVIELFRMLTIHEMPVRVDDYHLHLSWSRVRPDTAAGTFATASPACSRRCAPSGAAWRRTRSLALDNPSAGVILGRVTCLTIVHARESREIGRAS